MIKGPLGVTHHAWRRGCRVSLSSRVIVTTELEAIDLEKKKRKKGLKEVKLCSKSLYTMLSLCYFAHSKWSRNEVRNDGHVSK